MRNLISSKLKMTFNILSGVILQANTHMDYAYNYFCFLKENRNFYIPNTHFFTDSHEAHHSHVARSLMLIYDAHAKATGIEKFLILLKEELENLKDFVDYDPKYLFLVESDIKKLVDIRDISNRLTLIRNKKYMHIDSEAVAGNIPIDKRTQRCVEIDEEEMKILLGTALTIISGYEDLFDKPLINYVHNPEIVKRTIAQLAPFCFKEPNGISS